MRSRMTMAERLLLEIEKCYHDPERGKCECGKVAQEFVEAIQRKERRRAARIVRDYKCCQHRHWAVRLILGKKGGK